MSLSKIKSKKLARAWKKVQLQRARRYRELKLLNKRHATPVPARTSKLEFLAALRGTGGVKTRIAANLGVTRLTVHTLLQRPDWADVVEAYNDECEEVVDKAEKRILDIIENGDDKEAGRNARWLLNHLRKERFGDDRITIRNPRGDVSVNAGTATTNNTTQVNVLNNPTFDVSTLNLSPEVRRMILEAVDAEEERRKRKQIDAEVVDAQSIHQ